MHASHHHPHHTHRSEALGPSLKLTSSLGGKKDLLSTLHRTFAVVCYKLRMSLESVGVVMAGSLVRIQMWEPCKNTDAKIPSTLLRST